MAVGQEDFGNATEKFRRADILERLCWPVNPVLRVVKGHRQPRRRPTAVRIVQAYEHGLSAMYRR
jgi:hypothetical protein